MTSIIVTGLTALQWLVFAAISGFSRAPGPKSGGLRTAERNLLISTTAVAILWAVLFAIPLSKKPAVEAPAQDKGGPVVSCASIQEGMSSAAVASRLGTAEEVRPDEETRGPSASIWIYRQSRCAVHLFDDKVEFIE